MKSLLVLLLLGLSLQEIQGCGNTQTCRASCTNTEPNNCCVLEDDIPSSNNYPLGFVIGSIPATDSGMDPPCFRIPATEFSFANNDINYIVVGIQNINAGQICIEERNSNEQPLCETSDFFFCGRVSPDSTNGLTLDATCVDSCTAGASGNFWIRYNVTISDRDIENFCDVSGTIPLPSSLAMIPTDIPNMDSTSATMGGADHLRSLSLLSLLSLCVLVAKIFQ